MPALGVNLEALTAWAERVAARTSTMSVQPSAADVLTERLDRYLTHPLYGMAAFIAVMCSLFWTLFTFAAVPDGPDRGAVRLRRIPRWPRCCRPGRSASWRRRVSWAA